MLSGKFFYYHRKSNGFYRLLRIALNESDFEPLCIYQSVGDDPHNLIEGQVWVRPAKEFFDGRFTVAEFA